MKKGQKTHISLQTTGAPAQSLSALRLLVIGGQLGALAKTKRVQDTM